MSFYGSYQAMFGTSLKNRPKTTVCELVLLIDSRSRPTAKHSQPRRSRVTTLFELSFIALRVDTPFRTTFQSLLLRSEFLWYRKTESRCALNCAESAATPFQQV